jgi:hypothetical protein
MTAACHRGATSKRVNRANRRNAAGSQLAHFLGQCLDLLLLRGKVSGEHHHDILL